MRIVTLHDQAKLEIGEAAHWHNLREPGVGHELWQCVEAVLDVLQSCDIIPATPVSGRIAKRGIRRIFVDRFPYSIVFVQRDGEIEVLAFRPPQTPPRLLAESFEVRRTSTRRRVNQTSAYPNCCRNCSANSA